MFVAELREAFKLHDYDMDGKIFEADVGSCIRSVPGLKPSQHEIDEIKAYMDRGGKCGAKINIFEVPEVDIKLILSGVMLLLNCEPAKSTNCPVRTNVT